MHFRLAEFLVGVITGYIMYSEEISVKLISVMKNQVLLIAGWSLSVGFFWFHIFKIPSLTLSPITRLIYVSIERELWACSICWIVFACHRLKSGGIIRDFLSHPSWQPLSKLTLSMYLLHQPYFMYSTEDYPAAFGFLWLTHLHIGDIVFALFAAASAYVLIEAPAGKIVEILWKSPFLPRYFNENNQREKIDFVERSKCEETDLLIYSYSPEKNKR